MPLADATAARLLQLDQPDAAGDLSNGGLHAYWRKPDGSVIISGMGPHEVQAAMESGFSLLMPYGKFCLTPSHKGAWEPNTDPYYLLLSMGGIKEFTAKQIMEHRWHLRPHAVLAQQVRDLTTKGHTEREALDLVMPQLSGIEWQAEFCHLCPDRIFNDKSQLDRHSILHKAERTQTQMGETIATALAQAQQGNMAALGPMLQSISQNQEALTLLIAKLMGDRVADAPDPVAEAVADEPSPRTRGK